MTNRTNDGHLNYQIMQKLQFHAYFRVGGKVKFSPLNTILSKMVTIQSFRTNKFINNMFLLQIIQFSHKNYQNWSLFGFTKKFTPNQKFVPS